MSYEYDQQPQGLSSGAKVAIGCAAVAFLAMALICGGIVWVGYLAVDKAQEVVQQVVEELEKQTEAFAARFEAEGYERVRGQVVNVTSDIEKPTVYTVQVFQLNANSAADLAVMAQVAEIKGRIEGDLHFLGQQLTIHPEAVITGDLHVQMAQVVDNRGTVEGEVVEDDRLGIEFPGSVPLPDTKPAPGDVIETPAEPAAEPGEENAAPAEDAAPADGTTPADPAASAPSQDAAPGDAAPPADAAPADEAAPQNEATDANGSPTGEDAAETDTPAPAAD
jgi:hypothetical protein